MVDHPNTAVLLVEDDPDDILLIKRAFKKNGRTASLKVVNDVPSAIDYVQGTGEYSDRSEFPLPSYVLLDLRLPLRSGLEFLDWIKSTPGVKRIPVIILSSSTHHRDVERAYDLGANFYHAKRVNNAELADLLTHLNQYWEAYVEKPALEVS